MGLRVGEGSGHVRSGEDKSVAEIYPIPRPGLLRRAVDVNGERLEVGVGGLRPHPGRRERSRQRGATETQDFHRDTHDLSRSAVARAKTKNASSTPIVEHALR